MDGVLVVDKPAGVTSHDVVAAARRALRERRIGHTGTLDPIATGVLAMACGRATRLVRFLAAGDKEYDAIIRFGVATNTDDVTGEEIARSPVRPHRADVERALESLAGTYLQTPPAFSAKKVAGERAYALARKKLPVQLEPVRVSVASVELLAFDGETVSVRLVCSAGFYVRSFARSLGEQVGSVACLAGLRRRRSGEFTLDDSVTLEALARAPESIAQRLVPMDRLLGAFPSIQLDGDEKRRISHGQALAARLETSGRGERPQWVRLVDEDGHLVAVAAPGAQPGSLHPAVVLI